MKALLTLLIFIVGMVAQADPKSIHGMVVFGDEQTYVSHLPMFHAPHDYQFVAKVTMVNAPRSQTLAAYNHHKNNGTSLFTIAPTPFDLSKVVAGEKNQFAAKLYAGHFEQGGQYIGPVEIEVDTHIISKKLDTFATNKNFQEYKVFGEKDEYYMVHDIKEQPSFDFIAKATQPLVTIPTRLGPRLGTVSPDQLPASLTHYEMPKLSVPPGGFNIPKVGNIIGGFNDYEMQAEIIEVIYQNTDELAVHN